MVKRRIGAGIGDAVNGFENCNHKEENHHRERAVEEGGATSPGVDEEDGWEVRATLRMYWIEAVSKRLRTPAACIM